MSKSLSPAHISKVTACDVPEGSLLAAFGGPADYRDCFTRDVPGAVSLPAFLERFYTSTPFLPERLILKALRTPASRADIHALASGETDRFAAWKVVERREDEVLLESRDTGTASWFCVEPTEGGTPSSSSSEAVGQQTRLYFGSWVGGIDQSGWRAMLSAHVWYSKALLGGV